MCIENIFKPKSAEKWKALVEKCTPSDEKSEDQDSLFCEPINKVEQSSLLKLLQEKFTKNEAQVLSVFDAIFSHRIINTS